MDYDLTGIFSAFFVSLSLIGVFLQLKFILKRKKEYSLGLLGRQTPTSVLSLITPLLKYRK